MVLTTLAFVVAAAFAGDDKKPIELPHEWSVGTRYHIEFTRTREDIEAEKAPKVASSRTPVDVEVIAKRANGYTVRWTFGKPVVAAELAVGDALVERVSALVDGLKLDMLTDETGSITDLADPAAMEAHFDAGARALLAELGASKSLAPQDIEKLRQAVAGLKGPAFWASYRRFPTIFYMPSGSSLPVGEKRAYEDHLPNPFGGDPLPSQAYLQLREVRADVKEAIVEWRQTIDPTRAGPILEASIRALAKRTGQVLPTDAALSFDAIEDAATYVYDLTTGVPKSVVVTRATSMAGVRRIDTQRYDVTWPQAK